MKPPITDDDSRERAGWLPTTARSPDNPHMTIAFAKAYEYAATRITGPISLKALNAAGGVDRNTRLLDIGAGAGALSIPAAYTGARVTAVDIAPGMVELLRERLYAFPSAAVEVMNGEKLDFDDGAFDVAISVFGISLFQKWKLGLAEMGRVLRKGGTAAVATWRTPPGGGPFVVMAKALKSVFPDSPPPPPLEGFAFLSDPSRFADAMNAAGFVDVKVDEVDAIWEGPTGAAYLEELKGFHQFMGPYAALGPRERDRVDDAILRIVDDASENGKLTLTTKVLIGTGVRSGQRPTLDFV